MAHMTAWVHEYRLRDLLDDSFDLFKERVTTLILAAIIPNLLLVAYILVMRLFIYPGQLEMPEAKPSEFPQFWQEFYRSPGYYYLLGLMLVTTLTNGVAYIAQCRIATWHALGEPVSLTRAFRLLAKPFFSMIPIAIIFQVFESLGMMISVFFVAIIVGLLSLILSSAGPVGSVITGVVIVSLVLLVCGGVALLISALFLAAPIYLSNDHTGPFIALGKSFQATSTNFKAYFFSQLVLLPIPLMFWTLALLVTGLLQSQTSLVSPSVTAVLGTSLSGIGTMALWGMISCLQALVYVDIRCRKENLDLQLLAGEIGLGEEVSHTLAQVDAVLPVQATLYPDYSATLPSAPARSTAPRATLTAPAAGFPDYSAPPPAPVVEEPQGGPDAS